VAALRWRAAAPWGAALLLLLAPIPAGWVEVAYSRGAYRLVQPVIATVAALVPFALFDLLLVGVTGATVWWLVRGARSPRTEGARALARLATLWSAVVIAFMLTWGLNFRRVPLRESADFDASRLTPAAVRALAERTVRTLNETRAAMPDALPDDAGMRAELAPHFREASRQVAGWSPALSRPKATLLGWYMPRIGMNGYYLSLLHEVAINPDLLAFERPYVLAHEWAHGLGHANESEAAYVGWLACDRGPPWARYSAWLRVLDYLLDDLPRAELREVLAPLDSTVRADLAARRDRQLLRYSPTMRRVNTAVQDGAAAVARVEEHQRDYDLLVQLIIGMERPSPDGVQVPVGAPEVRDTARDHR
jgi:hypothetical protein